MCTTSMPMQLARAMARASTGLGARLGVAVEQELVLAPERPRTRWSSLPGEIDFEGHRVKGTIAAYAPRACCRGRARRP